MRRTTPRTRTDREHHELTRRINLAAELAERRLDTLRGAASIRALR